MSNFSSAHTVTLFDAKKSQALTGQRLAKARYKSTAKNPAKFPSICVSVPFISHDDITANVGNMLGHIRAMLENAQDGIIKSLYESADGAVITVTDSDISIDACIKYLESESTGGRLTIEFLNAWFDTAARETVMALIAEKLGYEGDTTPEQDATIDKHTAGYRDLIASLAGGKTILQPKQISSLKIVIGLLDTDETTEKLMNRLIGMENRPKVEDLLEL